MKIFALPELTDKTVIPVYTGLADSSMTPWRKPFFIPDFDTRFTMNVCPLINISRLGKAIPLRFASRYYTHGMIGIIFRAADMYDSCVQHGMPTSLAVSFDNSLLTSPKMTLEELSDIWKEGVAVSVNGQMVNPKRCVDVVMQADMAIHLLSRYVTLKTGDVLCLGLSSDWIEIKENDVISISESSSQHLIHSFVIK